MHPLVQGSSYFPAGDGLAHGLREFPFARFGPNCGRSGCRACTRRHRVQTSRERPSRDNGRQFTGGQSERQRLRCVGDSRSARRQATMLSSIRIEDVSDPAPLLLVNDVAPQLDAGQWTENAGLMDLSSAGVRWLFESKETCPRLSFYD